MFECPIGQYCSLAFRWGFVVIADVWGETPAFLKLAERHVAISTLQHAAPLPS